MASIWNESHLVRWQGEIHELEISRFFSPPPGESKVKQYLGELKELEGKMFGMADSDCWLWHVMANVILFPVLKW